MAVDDVVDEQTLQDVGVFVLGEVDAAKIPPESPEPILIEVAASRAKSSMPRATSPMAMPPRPGLRFAWLHPQCPGGAHGW
jgi:hypothetical protein